MKRCAILLLSLTLTACVRYMDDAPAPDAPQPDSPGVYDLRLRDQLPPDGSLADAPVPDAPQPDSAVVPDLLAPDAPAPDAPVPDAPQPDSAVVPDLLAPDWPWPDQQGTICTGGALTAVPYAAGAGTQQSPWIICTAAQLDHVRDNLNGVFRLEHDIDLTAIAFAPIGGCSPAPGFGGSFDGNHHTISSLTQSSTDSCRGLFGRLVGNAVVKQLRLTGVSVTGGASTGALAGVVEGSATVSACSSEGAVKAACSNSTCGGVGGLVGVLGFTGTSPSAGGTIKDCFSLVAAEGPVDVGGLVGWLFGELTNSYAAGTVTMTMAGGWGVGGLVGGQYDGTVRNCFATGAGNGQALVGNPFGGTRPNSFWDPDPGQFMTPSHSVYTQAPAWDFVNTWKINPSVSLPELR